MTNYVKFKLYLETCEHTDDLIANNSNNQTVNLSR